MGGIEFSLATEETGCGGAVDADVFEVGGEELMRGPGGKCPVVGEFVGFGNLGEGFEVGYRVRWYGYCIHSQQVAVWFFRSRCVDLGLELTRFGRIPHT